MELKDIKKSFFGFNKNSVMNYISELNHICAEKTESLQIEKNTALSELSQTNEKLNSKISSLEVEIDALKKELLKSENEIECLKHENEQIKNDFDTKKAVESEVAEILTEARNFAQSMREKTIHENELLRLENQKIYNAEKEKLEKYRENIRNVKTVIDSILKDTKTELEQQEEIINVVEKADD